MEHDDREQRPTDQQTLDHPELSGSRFAVEEDGVPAATERDETPAEQLDREWNELLQELRLTQTGLQLLSGFLLTLPFQGRFAELSQAQVAVFLSAVATATLATGLVVSPVVLHRRLFREHRKDVLVGLSHALARAGLGLLGLTIIAVTWLTFGFVLGEQWGPVAALAAAVVFAGLWLALPRTLAPRKHRPGQ